MGEVEDCWLNRGGIGGPCAGFTRHLGGGRVGLVY